jgi:hypothetical protein
MLNFELRTDHRPTVLHRPSSSMSLPSPVAKRSIHISQIIYLKLTLILSSHAYVKICLSVSTFMCDVQIFSSFLQAEVHSLETAASFASHVTRRSRPQMQAAQQADAGSRPSQSTGCKTGDDKRYVTTSAHTRCNTPAPPYPPINNHIPSSYIRSR